MGVKIALVLLCVLPLYCKSMSLAETVSKLRVKRVGDTVHSNEVLSTFRNQKELLQDESDKTNEGKRHKNVYVWNRSMKPNNLQATRNHSEKETVQSPVTRETPENQIESVTRMPQRIATQKHRQFIQKPNSSAQDMTKGILKEVPSKGVYFNGRVVDGKGDKGELKDTLSVYKGKHNMESKLQAKYVQGPAKKSRTERSLNSMFDLPPAVVDFLLHISPKDVNSRVYRRNAASLEENEESNTTDRSIKATTTVATQLKSSGDLNKFGQQPQDRKLQNLHKQELTPKKTTNLLQEQKSLRVQSKDFKEELNTKPGQAKQIRVGDNDSIKENKKLVNVTTKKHVTHENTKNYGKREVALGKPKSTGPKYNASQSNQIGDKEHTKRVEVIATKKDVKNEHVKGNEKLEATMGKSRSTENPKSSTGRSKYTIAKHIDKLMHELLTYLEREKNTTKKNLQHKNTKSNEKQEISVSEKSKFTEKPKSNLGQSKQIGAKDEIKEHKKEVEMKNGNIKGNEKQEKVLLGKSEPTEEPKSNHRLSKRRIVEDFYKVMGKLMTYIDQEGNTTSMKSLDHKNIKSNEKEKTDMLKKSLSIEKHKYIPGLQKYGSVGNIDTIIDMLIRVGDKDVLKDRVKKVEDITSNKTITREHSKGSGKREINLKGKTMFTDNLKTDPDLLKQIKVGDKYAMKEHINKVEDSTHEKNVKQDHSKSNRKLKITQVKSKLIEESKSNPFLSKYVSVLNTDKLLDMLIKHIDQKEDSTNKTNLEYKSSNNDTKREKDNLGKNIINKQNSNPGLSKQVRDKDMLIKNTNSKKNTTSRKNTKQEHSKNYVKREIKLVQPMFTENANSIAGITKQVKVRDLDFLFDYFISSLKNAGNNITMVPIKIRLVKPLNTVKTPKSSLEKQPHNGEVWRKDGTNYDSQLKKQTDSFGITKIENIFI